MSCLLCAFTFTIFLIGSTLESCSSAGYGPDTSIKGGYGPDTSIKGGYGPGTSIKGGSSPVVATYSGTIRGKNVKVDDANVAAFLGIPYAEPPIGNQRFKRAVPIRNWLGLYEATQKRSPCMQFSKKDFQWLPKGTPSEDCLYLNVWVPSNREYFDTDSNGKPILLWIHGGGFFGGSSDVEMYDGAMLAAGGNVIVASINYRLGVFGFFTSGTDDVPGNMGLFDQHLALDWIKNNIKQFGGDPDRITLVGESAGSVSIGLHLISPLTRNLFRRAIMESGTPYHPLISGNPANMIYAGNLFATAVGCADDQTNLFNDQSKVVDCLRQMDAMQLTVAESVVLEKNPFLFLPVYGNEFMPKNPIELLKEGDFKRSEILIGNNKDEGALFLHYIMPDLFGSQVALNVSVDHAKQFITGLFQNSTNPPPKTVVDFYLKDANDGNPDKTRKSVYDSFGDFIFLCPSLFFSEKFSKAGDVYFYYYTHKSSNSPWGDWMGVTHFEEVPYVFGDPFRNATFYTDEERKLSESIIQKWVEFASCGIPVTSQTEEWPKFTESHPFYLELKSGRSVTGEYPGGTVCEFWRSYFN